jgi:hypothetical protein
MYDLLLFQELFDDSVVLVKMLVTKLENRRRRSKANVI